jgi:exonuclease SbcD
VLILHTSDWHLGRSFKSTSLLGDQKAFINELIEVVKGRRVDLVVIAGDIFDRGLPPAEAVVIWNDALARIIETGAQVVAIAGNHDQGERIEMKPALTNPAVVVRGTREASLATMEFDDGPLTVVTVPFLDPFMARDLSQGEGAATHQSVIEGALAVVADEVAKSDRSLVVAHTFVTGGQESESERSLLQVGGSDQVGAQVFDGYSYAALGHLHRPQEVNGPTVAYSGTPLPYSFSENHAKSMRLVTMSVTGEVTVETVPIKAGRPVVTIKGSFEELLKGDEYTEYESHFVRAHLTDPTTQPGARDKLRERFAHILELNYLFFDDGLTTILDSEDFENKPDVVVRTFWEDVTGEPASHLEEDLLDAAIRAGFNDGGSA